MAFGALVEGGGTRFRVWAPRPRSLEVEIAGRRVELVGGEEGVREAFVDGVGAGERYRLIVDGERRVPDPASRAQPEGVHGPSEIVDPERYRWGDGGWRGAALGDAVLYELHVGTFSPAGDFDGVAARLDEIVAAGASAIEIMPVASFAGARGWGYDGTHWWAPHAAYGGPERLRALVDACHRREIAVVLDVVFNHFGPEGNYTAALAPYAVPDGTPWGDALDLDGPARAWAIACARALVREFHLDGLRLDAVHAFVDRAPPRFVADLAAALHSDGAARGWPVWVIAESDLGSARVVEDPARGGWGCDAMWADDLHHALHAALTGERDGYYADFGAPSLVARALERNLVQTGRHARFRGARFGEPAAFLDGKQLVAFLQNHDQIGNRARGERLATLRPECAWAAAAALLTAPFVPLLFQGEEWAERAPFPYFTSFTDEKLARAVSEGRRRERGPGPDPQAPATFFSAQLDPARGGPRGLALRRWYRALADLRRARPSLRASSPGRTEAIADGPALTVRRLGPVDETLACYSLGNAPTTIELPIPRTGSWRQLLDAASYQGPAASTTDGKMLTLAPWGAILFGAPA